MKIYKVTNLVNNKIYIGQTNSNNKYYKGSGTILKLAYKKYGKQNFKIETIIDNIISKEELDKLEEYYIKFYNSTNPIIGYNIANGATQFGIKRSKSTLEKIKEGLKGNKNASGKRSNETRLKIKLSKLGKQQTPEHIQKIKDSKLKNKENKIYRYIPKFYKRKSIICINILNNEELKFNSINDAAKVLKIKRTSIGNNLNRLSNLVNKKYKFIYNA